VRSKTSLIQLLGGNYNEASILTELTDKLNSKWKLNVIDQKERRPVAVPPAPALPCNVDEFMNALDLALRRQEAAAPTAENASGPLPMPSMAAEVDAAQQAAATTAEVTQMPTSEEAIIVEVTQATRLQSSATTKSRKVVIQKPSLKLSATPVSANRCQSVKS
jgi:hypothetical protein